MYALRDRARPLGHSQAYSEGFSLRWSQVDFEHKVIRLDNNVKTPGSAEPIPLSQYACDVLQAWKKESPPKNEYVFPSPVVPNKPISTVKTAWKATLGRAGVTAFPIYTLRHVFCTRLSEVAPDAVVQRHSPQQPGNQASLSVGNGRASPARSK